MSNIKLTIEGEGFSFVEHISKQRAGQIISLLGTDFVASAPDSGRNFVSDTKTLSVRGIRGEVSSLPTDASLEGYPDYYELPAKADKILWLLEYADCNGVKGLTSSEVDFLSSELKDRIEAKNFGAFNGRNMRSSYIKKMGRLFHVQKKGLDHLKSLGK